MSALDRLPQTESSSSYCERTEVREDGLRIEVVKRIRHVESRCNSSFSGRIVAVA